MNTLLLRLAAPMQAWGSDSKFSQRQTNREPTKSGVVGLIACALGRRRTESIDDLAGLRFGVRVDQPGGLIRDYHIALKEWGPATSHTSFLSDRYYLSDATFVAGLESDDLSFLNEIAYALHHPAFPLFLGRRSCPPTGKLVLGVREGLGLEDALHISATDWQASPWYRQQQPKKIIINIFCDDEIGDERLRRNDMPLSFDQTHRLHGIRNIRETFIEFENTEGMNHHDPWEGL
jgi:CRISPR system Cascade subunit CasD